MIVKDSFHMNVKISAFENIQIKPRFSSIIVGKPSLQRTWYRSSIPCKCPEKETALTLETSYLKQSIVIDRGKAKKKFD